MPARELLDDPAILLGNLPATSQQRRFVLAVAAGLLAFFGIAAPFAALPLPRFDAFIPSLQAIIFVNDLITSVLLFAQFAIIPSRAILVLASGYLFTALIVVPHALTFPGAFTPTGLLGAGTQTTAWLYFFWHIGCPAAILVYALLKHENRPTNVKLGSAVSAIGWSVATVIALVCSLALVATAGERFLPPLFADSSRHIQTTLNIAIPFILLISVFALASLWLNRRRSVLDYWLMLVILALVLEQILIALLSPARFSLGFYAGRGFSLVTSIVVLVLLLAETTKLYARLARSNLLLQRERNNKLMNLEAMVASISHEVRQPLGAIGASGNAALRFLGRAPPNVEEAQSALKMIVSETHRASQVFNSFRTLFGRADLKKEPLDVNELALGVLQALRGELKGHNITTRVALASKLLLVMGDSGQLQEVIINLVQNAIDAMDTIKDDRRVLQVTTAHKGADSIIVAVEDSGPGIDPKKLGSIFDAFVTTKPHGMGLGLAICRMIIERHEGQLSASPAHPRGAVFQIILPAGRPSPHIAR